MTLAEPPITDPVDVCGPRLQKTDGSWWECTFVDEFDGATLDRSKWLVTETRFSGMTSGNHDCYVDDPETISQADGVLRLTAQLGREPFTCPSPYGDFETTSTAATVTTRDRFTQTYGRFEFRAKFPDTAGLSGPHSALWLYPQNHTYGAWPNSGEIDVAEWFSSRPANVYPSVHYAGENPMLSTGFECAMPTAGSEFHSYVVEWSTTVMRFYYDDQLCFTHTWSSIWGPLAPQPFDHPFYAVLTQVWGNLWNAVTADSPKSATLEVDWVRVWK